MSRFTVISHATETEVGSIQSYDPYKDSRILRPCGSDITHAKITVHRDGHSRSNSHASQSTRHRSASNPRRGRVNYSATPNTARPTSSRGSLTSLKSTRVATPRARGPGLRQQRGVDFSQVRKQSNLGRPRKGSCKTNSVSSVKDVVNSCTAENRSLSPELPLDQVGHGLRAKGAPTLAIKTEDPTEIFTEELRHFSSNIAKDCDEAFKSSLPEDESFAASLADGDHNPRESPFAFSVDGSQELTPATDVSVKPWDRPLPPLPHDRTLVNASEIANAEYVREITPKIQHVARSVPVVTSKQADRRVVSLPVQMSNNNHGSKRTTTLPPINENKAVDVATNDKTRTVSAPPHTPKRKSSGTPAGVEYLTRVENSIRVVHSPTGVNPVDIPKPLNVRKASGSSGVAHQIHRHLAYGAIEEDEDAQRTPSQDSDGVVRRKKSAWFKRVSKAGTESSAAPTWISQDQTTLVNSEIAGPPSEAASSEPARKKKPLSFPFWKSNKSRDMKMMIAGKLKRTLWAAARWKLTSADGPDEASEIKKGVSKSSKTRFARKCASVNSNVRNIEVKQSWLARLLRVKPATDYVCMTLSRRRARQEVTILFREWRKYGISGIQVDKKRNIIFARVGAKNCKSYPRRI